MKRNAAAKNYVRGSGDCMRVLFPGVVHQEKKWERMEEVALGGALSGLDP